LGLPPVRDGYLKPLAVDIKIKRAAMQIFKPPHCRHE